MSTPYLTSAEFERAAFNALVGAGHDPDYVRKVIDTRFPCWTADALKELRARGLDITISHVEAYMLLKDNVITRDRKWVQDGGDFDPREMLWSKSSLEALAEFYVQITPAAAEPEPEPETVTLEEMLMGLRSACLDERIKAGCTLATSIGAGLALQGEEELDVEHIVSPALSDMLGRAMAGEEAAVAWLEASLETDHEGNPVLRVEGSRNN